MTELSFEERLESLAGRAASDFVLHREPMLLLDRLLRIGPEFAVCEWTVTPESSFYTPGVGIPTYVGVEHMAQCIAVHAGARARARGLGPPLGYLLGTRQFDTSQAWFTPDTCYRATCTELMRDDQGIAAFRCKVTLNDEVIASAQLSVLEKQSGSELSDE